MIEPDRDKDLRAAGRIPEETVAYLARRKRETTSKLKLVFFFALVMAVFVFAVSRLLKSEKNDNAPAATNAVQVSTAPPADTGTTSASRMNNVSSLNSCAVSDATDVLQRMSVMADTIDEGDKVIYRFKASWWETIESEKDGLEDATANADACLHKKARIIIFENPSGDVVGKADPISGIRHINH